MTLLEKNPPLDGCSHHGDLNARWSENSQQRSVGLIEIELLVNCWEMTAQLLAGPKHCALSAAAVLHQLILKKAIFFAYHVVFV